MEEFDLGAIWKDSEENANAYYEGLEEDIVEIARRQSSSVVQRMKRNAWVELLAGIFLWAGIFYWFRDNPLFGYLTGFGLILYLGTGVGLYKMLMRFREINSMNVLDSITAYLKLFRKSYRRAQLLMYVLLPIGYILGFFMGFLAAGGTIEKLQEPWKIVLILSFSVLVLAAFIWFTTRKYMYWMYGQYIEELQEIHDNLIEEEFVL